MEALYHISEEAGIRAFCPRTPAREDLPGDTGLVWALEGACLPNYLTPRDCPRVAYQASSGTSDNDRARFFSDPMHPYVVAIEQRWFAALCETALYCYAFDPKGFVLQDAAAGYYVSTQAQVPVAVRRIDNLPQALFARGVELRVLPSLWPLHDQVQRSTLRWSMCRMRGALPRP